MIQVSGVSKCFGEKRALTDLVLHVPAGSVYGLIGKNGAGKTTALRIIAGLLRPDEGEIAINGHSLSAENPSANREVGFVPDSPLLYDYLTVYEYMEFIAAIHRLKDYGKSLLNDVLRDIGLHEKRDELCQSLSWGMKQRLMLGSVLMRSPKALLLDEPLIGLDPQNQKYLKDKIKECASCGIAVVISSHLLDSVEKVCDEIGVIDDGHIVVEGMIDEVLRKNEAKSLEELFIGVTGSGINV